MSVVDGVWTFQGCHEYHHFCGFSSTNLHIYITSFPLARPLLLRPQFTTLLHCTPSSLSLFLYHLSELSSNFFLEVSMSDMLSRSCLSENIFLVSSRSEVSQLEIKLVICKSLASKLCTYSPPLFYIPWLTMLAGFGEGIVINFV